MSCCCWIRKKEQLVRREEEEEEQEEEEESRRKMDVSLLREQYRSTRETQRRHTQVLLRTVSDELSEAVLVVSVSQGLTLPWEPNGVTFDPDPATYGDPWRVHLDLHRRAAASSPETTTNANSSFRRSSSSSESPCSSFCSTTEEVTADGSRGDPGTGFSDGSREGPGPGSDDGPPSSLQEDLKGERSSPAVPQTAPPSRKSPALRFTRQLSLGGVRQSQNQNQHPFPNRKTPRISEAARRLGMYSSF